MSSSCFFKDNIIKEVLEIYSDTVTSDKDNKLKNIISSVSKCLMSNKQPNDKILKDHILNDIHNTRKIDLFLICRRLRSLLYNKIIPEKIRTKCLQDVLLVQKILDFSDIPDIKLGCVKVILSNCVTNIISYFINKAFQGELNILNTIDRFDRCNNKDSLSCFIDMYYGIEYLIISEILTKLLVIYFMSNSADGGGSVIVSSSVTSVLNTLRSLIKRNKITDRKDFKNIFSYLSDNLVDEFKGGLSCLKDITKDNNITKEDILKDPELIGAMNLALGEIKMPVLEPFELKHKNKDDKSDVFDTVFGSKAANNLKELFKDKHNMNTDNIISQLGDYKERINNGKGSDNDEKQISLENSFNFTEKDIDILYTLNLIEAIKSLGDGITPISEKIDKNITVNFYSPTVKANIDEIPVESETKDN